MSFYCTIKTLSNQIHMKTIGVFAMDEITAGVEKFKPDCDITKWNHFVLDFSHSDKKKNERIVETEVPTGTNGLYAFFDGNDCVKIGYSGEIRRRIIEDHCRELHENPPRWKWESKHKKKLTIYWKEFSSFDNKGEMKKCLINKYHPEIQED